MSELYQIYKIEKYDYPNDKGEFAEYLGTWENIGKKIRDVMYDYLDYEIIEGDDICKTIEKSGRYSYIFEDLDEFTEVSLKAEKSNQKRGVYYPRIFIPIRDRLSGYDLLNGKGESSEMHNGLPYDKNHLIKSLEQLSTLINSTTNIFRTVFPCVDNQNAFGFDIRNILILSCTEFETQIFGILKSNNMAKKHPKTCDYVKLKNVLKLHEYEIRFNLYPDLPIFSPFKNWDSQSPTKSIEWYDNYNKVKHDRDTNFHKGRLVDLINSISACYIMIVAQFGELPIINTLTGNYMSLVKKPKWENIEMYLKPFKNENWRSENYNG